MKEYIESIINSISKYSELTLVFIDENFQYNKEDHYVFVQSIPGKLLDSDYKIALLNMEQATRSNHKYIIQSLLKKKIKIFDYSLENISYITYITSDRYLKYRNTISYIPYQYNDEEINKLLSFNSQTKKIYDIVCVGCKSHKRSKIYDELNRMGYKMLYLDGIWGDERDEKLHSAKLLLNIHYGNDYNIYEALRCDRLIFSKMMVISEKSFNNELLDIKNLVIFEDYNNLTRKCAEVIQNYATYYKDFLQKYEANINLIKKNRFKQVNQITEFLER